MSVSRARLLLLLLLGALSSAPSPAQAGPREVRAGFLRALQGDFRQGAAVPTPVVLGGYATACRGGEELACRHRAWHRADGANLASALMIFSPACDTGDALACLVVGWSLGLVEPGYTYGAKAADAGAAESAFAQACAAGLQEACIEREALAHASGRRHPATRPLAPERKVPVAKGTNEAAAKGTTEAAAKPATAAGPKAAADAGPTPDARPAADAAAKPDAGQGAPAATQGNPAPRQEDRSAPEGPSVGTKSPSPQRDNAPAALHRACTEGDRPRCTALGRAYLSGGGVPRSQTRAAAWFAFACDGDDAEGCHLLAKMRRVGLGGPRDRAAGVLLDQKACERGWTPACDVLKRDPAQPYGAEPAAARARDAGDGYGGTLGVSYALAPLLAIPTLGTALLLPPLVHGANGEWGRFGHAIRGVALSTLGGGAAGALLGAAKCGGSQADNCAVAGFFVMGTVGYIGWSIYDTSANSGPSTAIREVRVLAVPRDDGLAVAIGGGF